MRIERQIFRLVVVLLVAAVALAGGSSFNLVQTPGSSPGLAAAAGAQEQHGSTQWSVGEQSSANPGRNLADSLSGSISSQANGFEATLHSDVYNVNTPDNAHIYDLDGDGDNELLIVGTLTDYSWIPTANSRCNWCNEWRLESYSWDGSDLTLAQTGKLDVGYDTTVYSDVGIIGGETKVAGVGNMYPCGSGEPHAGMAVFDDQLQEEHHDWGNRGGSVPCHAWFSVFQTVGIADLNNDGTEEIVAGGSGDSSGGTSTYRGWLLTIRNSDGTAFEDKVYQHFDHGGGNEILTDLVVADVDGDGTQEIVATGYSTSTGSIRTWLRIMTWDGSKTTVDTEYSGSFNIGSEDYLQWVAVGNADDEAHKEIVLAGRAKTGTNLDWYVKVLRWDGATLTEVADTSWSFGDDAQIKDVEIADVDQDGQNEILLAGYDNWTAVPGSSGGYGYLHYYSDWHFKAVSLSGTTWTEEMAMDWDSSRDYDSNDNGKPDSADTGALGRLYDMAVGDLNGDNQMEVVLVGKWIWTGWHVKILGASVVSGEVYVTSGGTRYPLRNVAIELQDNSAQGLDRTTTTDSNGRYSFTLFHDLAATLELEVRLKRPAGASGNYFEVRYTGKDRPAYVQTGNFRLDPGQSLTKDIDFAAEQVYSDPDTLAATRANLAMSYYYIEQVFDYVTGELDAYPGATYRPMLNYGYSNRCVACYIPSTHEVHIAQGQYALGGHSRPKNCEWHETFHHLMEYTIDIPARAAGDCNHCGYANSSTGDSWTEGWAIFWPTQLASHLGQQDPHLYLGISEDINYLSWTWQQDAAGTVYYYEDFAVATLLYDLVDDTVDCGTGWRAGYCDNVQIGVDDLWDIIGNTDTNNLRDVKDLYDALAHQDNDVGQTDTDNDGTDDLDELFILHGFFADTDDNSQYDAGEEVGKTADQARPDRRNRPLVAGSYLKLNFEGPDGRPVSDNTVIVEVTFPAGSEILDYSFEVEVEEATGALVYLELPPEEVASVSVRVRAKGGKPGTELTTDNAQYWQAVQTTTTDYAVEQTFVIEWKAFLPIAMRR